MLLPAGFISDLTLATVALCYQSTKSHPLDCCRKYHPEFCDTKLLRTKNCSLISDTEGLNEGIILLAV